MKKGKSKKGKIERKKTKMKRGVKGAQIIAKRVLSGKYWRIVGGGNINSAGEWGGGAYGPINRPLDVQYIFTVHIYPRTLVF